MLRNFYAKNHENLRSLRLWCILTFSLCTIAAIRDCTIAVIRDCTIAVIRDCIVAVIKDCTHKLYQLSKRGWRMETLVSHEGFVWAEPPPYVLASTWPLSFRLTARWWLTVQFLTIYLLVVEYKRSNISRDLHNCIIFAKVQTLDNVIFTQYDVIYCLLCAW